MRDGVQVKYAIDERLAQADGLEDLRAAVAGERRDAHLGHHLEDALVERLDVVLDRLLVREARQLALPDHVVQRLEREIRVHRAGAVAEQQRAVVHFARVARLERPARSACACLRAPGGGARRPSPAGSGSPRASASTPRSERIRIVQPSATAALASRQSWSIARSRPGPSSAGS